MKCQDGGVGVLGGGGSAEMGFQSWACPRGRGTQEMHPKRQEEDFKQRCEGPRLYRAAPGGGLGGSRQAARRRGTEGASLTRARQAKGGEAGEHPRVRM